jgi:two-component system, LytTR family, response regulator
MIRTLIVDDEPLARSWLRGLLEDHDDIEILAECANGVEAVDRILVLDPDLVFLDVQMPELDGLGVLQMLSENRPKCLVFVTAFDKFAIRAFELHAMDYLLKPFDRDRFQVTLERARTQLAAKRSDIVPERLQALLDAMPQLSKRPDRIAVKDNGAVFFVRVADVDWIEAYGNYVRLHVGETSHLLLQTMTGMEAKLDPERFLRIHRSTIVNIDRIARLEPLFHGEYSVRLTGGAQLTLSRGYREKLQALLERFS